MAQRDVSNYNSVTQVLPKQLNSTLGQAAEMGKRIITTNQEARITEGASAAQLEMSKFNQQYQLENQADPLRNIEQYKVKQQEILDKYGADVSPLFQRDWQDQASRISSTNFAATEAWAFKQTQKNSITSINNTMMNNYSLANADGQTFGTSGQGDVMATMNYLQSRQQLEQFGNRNLGEVTTQEELAKYKEDYAKSFIAGVAETNPEKALSLLDDPQFKDMVSHDQRGEFVDLIGKTQKRQELQKTLKQTVNNSELPDIVNDEAMTYFEKRLEIDRREAAGEITPKAASQSRRVLTSQKDVDSITSTPVMSDIIKRVYDLNSQADINASDYLLGVQNIQEEILNKQADGVLQPTDVQKLNGEIKTLTSKKISDATRAVGSDFYEANEMFNALPPEYRGKATRDLFYITTGNGISESGYNKAAQDIINQINFERRDKALKSIDNIVANKGRVLSEPPEIQMVGTPTLAASAIPTIKSPSDEAFKKLASGEQFLDSNGQLRVKN